MTWTFTRSTRRALAIIAPALLLGMAPGCAARADGEGAGIEARLKAGGHVLVIRHARAPGVGDPPGFRIGDCATQRNLDDDGRAQAKAAGEWLRARGVARARVYSSQWCRCLETARLLGLGPVMELAPLNSYYERPEDREPNLGDLRRFLAERPRDGPLLVLVTHQVVVQGLTGKSVASGAGILLELTADGSSAVVGAVRFVDSATRAAR